jgi:2-iminobutanoate/2-iminopropanoate deaminase
MSSAKIVIATDKAPAVVASYSQAVRSNGFVFCSGQIPLDPVTNELVQGTIAEETRRCLDNLTAVLQEAGSGWDEVVKVTAYLTDIGDYVEFNDAYASYVGDQAPARAAVAVAALPKGARVEVECIAAG